MCEVRIKNQLGETVGKVSRDSIDLASAAMGHTWGAGWRMQYGSTDWGIYANWEAGGFGTVVLTREGVSEAVAVYGTSAEMNAAVSAVREFVQSYADKPAGAETPEFQLPVAVAPIDAFKMYRSIRN